MIYITMTQWIEIINEHSPLVSAGTYVEDNFTCVHHFGSRYAVIEGLHLSILSDIGNIFLLPAIDILRSTLSSKDYCYSIGRSKIMNILITGRNIYELFIFWDKQPPEYKLFLTYRCKPIPMPKSTRKIDWTKVGF